MIYVKYYMGGFIMENDKKSSTVLRIVIVLLIVWGYGSFSLITIHQIVLMGK